MSPDIPNFDSFSQKEKQRETARHSRWIQAIHEAPETTYAYYLQTDFQSDQSPGTILPLKTASHYLLARDSQEANDKEGMAEEILTSTLHSLLQSGDLGRTEAAARYNELVPHLARIIPDIDALNALVLQYPSLIEQDRFYSDWKNAYIDTRLRQKAEALLGDLSIDTLQRQDVVGFDVAFKHLGVPYEDLDEMETDLRKYFVYSIGDLTQVKTDRTIEVTESVSATTSVASWSRSDETILQDDIITPFRQWLAEQQAWKYSSYVPYDIFKTEAAKRGGTPYKYELTTFAEHAITIGVDTSGERPVFHLNMRGGGITTEAFPGERLERFATFVDKEIIYPDTQIISIAPNLPFLEIENEDLAQKEAELRASGQTPAIEKSDGERSYERWQCETWELPYNKTPHRTTVEILHQIMGNDTSIYCSTEPPDRLKPKQIIELDRTPQEARLIFRRVSSFDDAEKRPGYMNIAGKTWFIIPDGTPEQAQKLKFMALAYHTAPSSRYS